MRKSAHTCVRSFLIKRQMSLTVVTHNTYIRPYLCIFSQIEFCICKSLCVCLKVEVFFLQSRLCLLAKHWICLMLIGTTIVPYKAHDLCAHAIWSDCRARFMCSHCNCEILFNALAQKMTPYMDDSQRYLKQ